MPVLEEERGRLVGVEAVIDKDLTAALLARLVGADGLVILTDVDGVYEKWGTQSQQLIRDATPSAMKAEDFSEGSMRPKVNAVSGFVQQGGQYAAIGNLTSALDVVEGLKGTIIR
ncbi:MAG: hypothetical protein RIC29_05980 [Rhodospirillaceae bacterium]